MGGPRDGDAVNGDGVGWINIDLVPSTNRPPSGGPLADGGGTGGVNDFVVGMNGLVVDVNDVAVGSGDREGPAPGD